MVIVRKCDRCGKEIPDTQQYTELYEGVILNKSLCKDCVNILKKYLDMFWDFKSRIANREKFGSVEQDFNACLPKGFSIGLASMNSMPIKPVETIYKNKIPKKGYQPSNIFTKLLAMLFFQKVEEE